MDRQTAKKPWGFARDGAWFNLRLFWATLDGTSRALHLRESPFRVTPHLNRARNGGQCPPRGSGHSSSPSAGEMAALHPSASTLTPSRMFRKISA